MEFSVSTLPYDIKYTINEHVPIVTFVFVLPIYGLFRDLIKMACHHLQFFLLLIHHIRLNE